jgi:hypothetical protein
VVPVSDELTTAEIVDAAIARWDELRQEAAGDERFRTWFLHTVPVQAGAEGDPDSHAFLAFEIAHGLLDRGRTADFFLLLGWVGRHFAAHPDADFAARSVMALTDTCAGTAVDAETRTQASRVLREVIDSVRTPADVRVERALCRALAHVAYLRGEGTTLDRATVKEIAALWREIAGRCGRGEDPELRWRLAHALGNEALLWLQAGREDLARQGFATITDRFAADPPGVEPELDLWVSRARHAPGTLDRFDVGEPELKLGYLERQRYWDRRRRLRGLGPLQWLRAGAPRNQLATLVRRARETHQRSVGTVRSWLCTGEPFVLLLRNFELTEQSGISARPDLLEDPEHPEGDHVQVISFRAGAGALTELAAGLPLVYTASTTAAELELKPYPGQFTGPVRLYLPDETWFDTVSTLIAVADQVIVWASELSSALTRELELLVAGGRTADTLVLVESADRDPFTQVFLPKTGAEALTADHPMLAAFPNVAEAAELKDRHVAECPPLMRVAHRLAAARELPIERRLAALTDRLDARSRAR